ncbi:MAG: histidinol-phosphate transaminase [Cyanobacteria bacterium RI_101]|nr:histidinol-phosphate transaminase [Cyanobacteria bacterium RI_101]
MLPIRASVRQTPGYTPGEQPQTTDFIKLNTNENPYPPPASILAALEPELEKLRLYPDPVSRRLRQAAAETFGVQPEQILAGNGSDDILNIALRTFVDPGQTVGVLDLTYSLYQTLTAVHGAELEVIATNERFELSGPIISTAPLLFLASPNPPVGKHLNKDFLRATCARHPGIVLIDEAYIDFGDEDHWDLLAEFENAIISRTLSKSYSLAGMRVGFAIGAPALIREMDKVRDSYNLDRLAQALGTAALKARADFIPLWQKIRATRIRLSQGLTALGFEVLDSDSNFVLASPSWIPAPELYQKLKDRKILVRYFNHPRILNFVRITVGTDAEIDRLLAAVAELKG